MLFAGEEYYPQAGWANLFDDFDSLEEAIKTGRLIKERLKLSYDIWIQIVDTKTKQPVHEEGHPYGGFTCRFRKYEFPK